jgi:signal transduction histidine kinase
VRLWVKLALFGVLGVAATHTLHLAVGRELATNALSKEQLARARDLGRLVAAQTTDSVLLEDQVALQQAVDRCATDPSVTWCFVERDGRVLASTFHEGTPSALVTLRRGPPAQTGPIIVRAAGRRYLDITAPILDGAGGAVRVGLDLAPIAQTREALGLYLGLVALVTIAVGVLAALLVGRGIARPVKELLEAADHFVPSQPGPLVPVHGNDEFAELTERFNEMMTRLRAAHEAHEASVRKAASSERLVALGSLVAGVAHEVNNPLAGLKNVQAALRKGALSPERQSEYIELMGEALARIESIVGRLLEFGRPRPLALKPHTPRELVDDVLRLLGPAARQRGVSLVRAGDVTASEPVHADRVQLGQALTNLVLNALYVTPKGGAVRLRAVARPGWRGIAVEDDGPGIPPELRERVLDPFFSTKPEGEGTGLGLSVTRTIVDAHRGELAFDFPSSGGTVATIWLPLAAAS